MTASGAGDDVAMARLSVRALDALLQDQLGNRPDDLIDDLTVLDEENRRNGTDAITRCQRRTLVHVDLHQHHSPLRGPDQLVEDRRDRPAWTAPLRPEINQHQTLGRDERLVEVP